MESKMPAPCNSDLLVDAFKSSLNTNKSYNSYKKHFNSDLISSSKKLLLNHIDYEEVETDKSDPLKSLKSKYILLNGAREISNSTIENNGKVNGLRQLDASPQMTKKLVNHKDKCDDFHGFPVPKVQLFNPDKIILVRRKDSPVGAGMINIGNTCYMNSCLQVLLHCPAFSNWLRNEEHYNLCKLNVNFMQQCTICAVYQTLKASMMKSGSVIKPIVIFKLLKSICKSFIPGNQEDAHEFLRHLIASMEKSYLISAKATKLDSLSKETTPLNYIFGGYLRSQVLCLQCRKESNTWEHFQDLLLDLKPGCTTIEECLMVYFKKEKLDGDNAYYCAKCKTKVPALKKYSIEKVPPVMIITLKRFNCFGSKISRPIQFSQTLNVSNFLAGSKAGEECKYKLLGLVNHHGPSPNCGHYTAVAETNDNQYHKFDDNRVYPISLSSVLNQSSAYILIYELINKSYWNKSSQGNTNDIKNYHVKCNTVNEISNDKGAPRFRSISGTHFSTNQTKIKSECENSSVHKGENNIEHSSNGSSSKIVCHNSNTKLVSYVDDSDSDSSSIIKMANNKTKVTHVMMNEKAAESNSVVKEVSKVVEKENSLSKSCFKTNYSESNNSSLSKNVLIEYDNSADRLQGRLKSSAEFLPRSVQVNSKTQFKLKSTNNSGCWSVDGIQMASIDQEMKNADESSVPSVKVSSNIAAAFISDFAGNNKPSRNETNTQDSLKCGNSKSCITSDSKSAELCSGADSKTTSYDMLNCTIVSQKSEKLIESRLKHPETSNGVGDTKSTHKKHKKKKKNKRKQRSRSSSESSSSEFEWVEKPRLNSTTTVKTFSSDSVKLNGSSDPFNDSRFKTVEILESMNSRGYGNKVRTWDGKLTSLDSEIHEEMVYNKRKKYDYDSEDELDRGKVKKIKKYKHPSKSFFNPFQNFQNIKDRSVSFFSQSRQNGNTHRYLNGNKY